jgi:DNA helicase HerA-like ATPase
VNGFRFPGGDARTLAIGATGTGKSTCATWMLAHQRFDRRPWCIIDFKHEMLFDLIGIPPIQQISFGTIPRKPGLYLISPRPDQDDQLEAWLWKVWERENIGLYVDEATLMPDQSAFRAVLQQGRSKRIPVIACTQRPVSVMRGLFSEASYFAVYRMADKRDYKTVEGFIPADLSLPLPAYHWHWYDVQRNTLLHMGPVPRPKEVADLARSKIPHRETWHPFGWTSEPTGRPAMKRA